MDQLKNVQRAAFIGSLWRLRGQIGRGWGKGAGQRAKQYTQVICFAPLMRVLVCRTGVIDGTQTALFRLPMRQREKQHRTCAWPVASVAPFPISTFSKFFFAKLNARLQPAHRSSSPDSFLADLARRRL